MLTRSERRREERAARQAEKKPYSFLEEGGSNRREKRYIAKKSRAMLVHMEKGMISKAKRQAMVDEYISEEIKRIRKSGVLLLPGVGRLMGRS